MRRTKSSIEEHLLIIRKVAWEMHQRTGHDIEDLFSEGCLAYLSRTKQFYKYRRKGKFTSFLWIITWTAMLSYVKEQNKIPFAELTDEIISNLSKAPIRPEITMFPQKEVFKCGEFQAF